MTKETQKAILTILELIKNNIHALDAMHTLITQIINKERTENVKNPDSPNLN